jgi:aryl-alcohol dehydrogenase-like predicted oxidoreductase
MAAAQPVLANLRAVSESHGVDAATVAIAWLLTKGVVPLVGAKSGEQAASNAAALRVSLSEADVAALDSVTEPWCVAR